MPFVQHLTRWLSTTDALTKPSDFILKACSANGLPKLAIILATHTSSAQGSRAGLDRSPGSRTTHLLRCCFYEQFDPSYRGFSYQGDKGQSGLPADLYERRLAEIAERTSPTTTPSSVPLNVKLTRPLHPLQPNMYWPNEYAHLVDKQLLAPNIYQEIYTKY